MEIVFKQRNMIFWKSNHKTNIIKTIIKIAENMLKVEKKLSDCSKCRETGGSEEQSRKDTSSVCFELVRSEVSFFGTGMSEPSVRNPVYEEKQQGVNHLRDDSWCRAFFCQE